jgi:hypothetical protein
MWKITPMVLLPLFFNEMLRIGVKVYLIDTKTLVISDNILFSPRGVNDIESHYLSKTSCSNETDVFILMKKKD